MKTCAWSCIVGLSLALVMGGGCGQPRPVAPVPLPPLDASASGPIHEVEYRLQPGDVLRIKFLYHPELDVKLPVRPDGNITLQDVGEVTAGGLTTNQLAEVVRQHSSEHLRDPEVTVIVAELGEQKVYVAGEVRLPGIVPYRPGLTALQAIMDRGGFTDVARVDSVVHITVGEKDYQATKVDLTRVLQGEPESVQLAARDMIFVPRTTIGDVNAFVDLYIRRMLPVPPRIGVGFAP
jgi:protein involved in polysaccharide export with SLBB domain